MNRWHPTIMFLKSWAYNWVLTLSSYRELDHSFGQSASQQATKEWALKLNGIECHNLTHFWGNDPFWGLHSTLVSLAIIESKFFDGLCHLKDGFFQCFNFFHAGLVFCEVLDFYGEIFKHSYRFLQLHKIIPRHWPASLIYTIHIKDAEKVQGRPQMVFRVFID